VLSEGCYRRDGGKLAAWSSLITPPRTLLRQPREAVEKPVLAGGRPGIGLRRICPPPDLLRVASVLLTPFNQLSIIE
jgi:hypothetical protein